MKMENMKINYKYITHNTKYREKQGKTLKDTRITKRYFKKSRIKHPKNRNYFFYEMINKEELKEKINRNLKPITFFYYNL